MAIVDMDKAGEGYMVVPSGIYKVRVKKFEKKVAKTSGNEMIQWTGVIVEGPQTGASLSDFNTLNEKAAWKVAKFIKAAGVDIGGQLDTDSVKFTNALNTCIGQTMYWQVTEGADDQGNPRNKVETYARDSEQQSVAVVDMDNEVPDFAKG
jgi:hypothetical protein